MEEGLRPESICISREELLESNPKPNESSTGEDEQKRQRMSPDRNRFLLDYRLHLPSVRVVISIRNNASPDESGGWGGGGWGGRAVIWHTAEFSLCGKRKRRKTRLEDRRFGGTWSHGENLAPVVTGRKRKSRPR